MSRFATLRACRFMGMMLIAMATLVVQVPSAAARPILPSEPSPGYIDSPGGAQAYCQAREPDQAYCTHVHLAKTKEQVLDYVVSDFCTMASNSITSGRGEFRLDDTANGPVVINTSLSAGIVKVSKYYDMLRAQGLLPDTAPKDFVTALRGGSWWRPGCGLFGN